MTDVWRREKSNSQRQVKTYLLFILLKRQRKQNRLIELVSYQCNSMWFVRIVLVIGYNHVPAVVNMT